jgi:hypothetical protein
MQTELPKPKKHTMEYFDYHEVAQYVESVLGYEIRDTLGKFSKGNKDAEYRDFWHWLINKVDISNGSFDYMPFLSDYEDCEDEDMIPEWVKPILKVFNEVIGEEKVVFAW